MRTNRATSPSSITMMPKNKVLFLFEVAWLSKTNKSIVPSTREPLTQESERISPKDSQSVTASASTLPKEISVTRKAPSQTKFNPFVSEAVSNMEASSASRKTEATPRQSSSEPAWKSSEEIKIKIKKIKIWYSKTESAVTHRKANAPRASTTGVTATTSTIGSKKTPWPSLPAKRRSTKSTSTP